MRSRFERTRRQKAFRFVATDLALALAAFAASGVASAQTTEAADTAVLSDMVVTEDVLSTLTSESTGSSIGFTKPILETPRTVSFVSSEQIALMGITSVDDLSRVVPGTFTTTRYGLQGGINVRGVAADMYFRGMKRINMQGHARTSLASMDSIEVIKGPPSPIFGMGKIGGYSNLTPKAGRAKVGAYMDQVKGFTQLVGGDYRKSEASMGAGGPISVLDKSGGFYVYGLLEDSESYTKKVGAQQRILQGTVSLDNAVGPFRLEAGTQAQNSITSGAYMNRVTQNLIDNGKYVRGRPLVNLDSNNDGAVGFRETWLNSPTGSSSTAGGFNRPLNQTFVWPTCNGAPCEVGKFPPVPGIPQALMTEIMKDPEGMDPTGALRNAGVGGPRPGGTGANNPLHDLPVGFVLDPRTVDVVDVDYRGNGAYERVQDAELALFFIDLVNDSDPDFTIKNQFFHDYLNSFKNSFLPYGEKQDIHLWENKFTVTKRIPDEILPEWLRVNTLSSLNYRQTKMEIKSSGGDFDYRQDIMYQGGDHYPNTMFWNQLDNASYDTGAPRTRDAYSKFNEMGFGFMFDIDLFAKTNLVLGARIDGSVAEGSDYARFDENSSNDDSYNCTVAGRITGPDGGCFLPEASTKSWDDGTSWSASISQKLPFGLRPYATFAVSSVALDTAANQMTIGTINSPGGHIGDAELQEFGIKGSWLNDTLFLTLSQYTQTRTDISNAADPTESAEISSTETTGVETELKWNPTRELSIQAYAIFQEQELLFASTANMEFSARELGFQDVVDSNGKVIYPAEAFLYGGRYQVALPAELREKYKKTQGNPEEQYGLNMNYNLKNGLGFLFGGNYFSSTYMDRTQFLQLPSSVVANAGVTLDRGKWHLKLNGYNIFDELQFRSGNSQTRTTLVSVMPGARYEVTVKLDF